MHGLSRYSVGQWPCALDGYVSRIHNANFSLIGHRHDPRPARHTHTHTHTRALVRVRLPCPYVHARDRAREHTHTHTRTRTRWEKQTTSPQVVRGKYKGRGTHACNTFAMPRCSLCALNEPHCAEQAKTWPGSRSSGHTGVTQGRVNTVRGTVKIRSSRKE